MISLIKTRACDKFRRLAEISSLPINVVVLVKERTRHKVEQHTEERSIEVFEEKIIFITTICSGFHSSPSCAAINVFFFSSFHLTTYFFLRFPAFFFFSFFFFLIDNHKNVKNHLSSWMWHELTVMSM